MTSEFKLLAIILLPLFGSVIQAVLGLKDSKKAGFLATIFVFLSFLLHFSLTDVERKEFIYIPFIIFSDIEVYFSLTFDRISFLMGLMVTFVSSLIHLYSSGYMEKDDSPYRYFAFLNLFVFFMLVIVYSGNFLMMFIGWEGVGVCSYLLISYESWRDDAARAGTKAFLLTRLADFGFILFLLIYYKIFKTFDIAHLKNAVKDPLLPYLLFFAIVAACGKSAQFPFYVWLPDAMEGPTPVSALIHAATMVTAGVWLFIRVFPLFSLYPDILNIIIFISVISFLLSGLIACFEKDLKKILAYSTISQIGYMFFGIGIGYKFLAFLHLLTHAFFKALLFLSSGNVMHLIHKKIDIYKTRGIRKVHSFTSYSFLVGALALIGFPLTGGFISKELLINASFDNLYLFSLACLGAFITSFYIIRAYALTFEGNAEKKEYGKIDPVMNISLLILSFFVILTGLPLFEEFYFDILESKVHVKNPIIYQFFPLFLSVLGGYFSFQIYLKNIKYSPEKFKRLASLLGSGFYYDYLISKILYGSLVLITNQISKLFDRGLIDILLVEGAAKITYLKGKLTYKLFVRKPSFYITLLIFLFFLILFLYF
ncbi:MAG: NADH-quinone oxidoreductase subunit L [Candidatus Hydrothermales bacterium]